ncbi:F-box only protein 15 [Dryobates pubescens]|uniref:F-box only protein 15 n=1 Tax=Dryobates pubescens TaxID=118200 RepID=UPI0023B94A93|nr:F-box only protein 15 [Dryobates pubescens]
MKPEPRLSIESLPPEMLIKIFSLLDAESLLSLGCVNRSFYQLASDNAIWLTIYSRCFKPKRAFWKVGSGPTQTLCSGGTALQDKSCGPWKEKYISRQIAAVQTRAIGFVNSLRSPLPCKIKEAMRAAGLSWMLILKEKNGREHPMAKRRVSFQDTSLSIFWYGINWPCLDVLAALRLYGVVPLFPQSKKSPSLVGPCYYSLIAEYHLADLTALSADKIVQLFTLKPGLLVGLWKDTKEIAFVSASLHYHQLMERSILGSAARPYAPPPHQPLLDDTDPEYGLHGYCLDFNIHSGSCAYMCGTFGDLFCRKGEIADGYVKLTAVRSLQNNMKLCPLGTIPGLSWHTEELKGTVKECCVLDLTLLDENGETFWCFSAPVSMELSSRTSNCYKFLGQSYIIDYCEPSEGRVCIEFVYVSESRQYIVVSFVIYVSTKKVNEWYGTDY